LITIVSSLLSLLSSNQIDALIVPNNKAPLLLGQTALAKFGKISIDYERGIITFD
jgi:aspartyl protease family protein